MPVYTWLMIRGFFRRKVLSISIQQILADCRADQSQRQYDQRVRVPGANKSVLDRPSIKISAVGNVCLVVDTIETGGLWQEREPEDKIASKQSERGIGKRCAQHT